MSQSFIQCLSFSVAIFFPDCLLELQPTYQALEQCTHFNDSKTYLCRPTSSPPQTKHTNITILIFKSNCSKKSPFFIHPFSVSVVDKNIFLPQIFSSSITQQFNKYLSHLSLHRFSKVLNQIKHLSHFQLPSHFGCTCILEYSFFPCLMRVKFFTEQHVKA